MAVSKTNNRFSVKLSKDEIEQLDKLVIVTKSKSRSALAAEFVRKGIKDNLSLLESSK